MPDRVTGQEPEEVFGQEPDTATNEPEHQDIGGSGQEPRIATGQEPAQSRESYVVRQLRREAAEARKRLREFEERVRQEEEAKMTEAERLRRQLSELERERAIWERERQERTLRYETMLAAGRLGIIDPEAAYRLVDIGEVEFDDDGNPTNIEQVLRALVAKRPYLAGAGSSSPTNPARSQGSPVFTRSQLRDHRFFEEHREEILAAMREGRIREE